MARWLNVDLPPIAVKPFRPCAHSERTAKHRRSKSNNSSGVDVMAPFELRLHFYNDIPDVLCRAFEK